jgi:hypothetical protein
MPETTNVSNDASDEGASCRRINQCDEISREESERVNWCELACDEANMYSAITPLQKVCFLFGLLLIVLSGTICLNFYREAIKCPPKLCSPWYREVPGRVLLRGSVTWAIGLLIWIITQLCELATGGRLLGGGDDFLYAVVFVCITGLQFGFGGEFMGGTLLPRGGHSSGRGLLGPRVKPVCAQGGPRWKIKNR